MYIDKDNNVGVGEHLDLKYLKNKDGKTTNPRIWMWTKLNLTTNEFIAPTFTVTCFDNKETFGYTNRTFTTYSEAKECLDEVMNKYHVEQPIK